jgi:hypothetical protein
MKTEDLRELITLANELGIDKRELYDSMESQNDFEIDDYRFIHSNYIDEIQVDELESDPYILGGFNDWFIADNTDLSIDIVEALQKAEAYEAIGNHIIDNGFTSDLQKEYARFDGYGHHFAHYDSDTNEFGNWFYFRIS